jgi:hypothetical protein
MVYCVSPHPLSSFERRTGLATRNERILLPRSRVLRFQRSSFASSPRHVCSQTELPIREVARLRLRNCALIQADYGGPEFDWAQSLAKDGAWIPRVLQWWVRRSRGEAIGRKGKLSGTPNRIFYSEKPPRDLGGSQVLPVSIRPSPGRCGRCSFPAARSISYPPTLPVKGKSKEKKK